MQAAVQVLCKSHPLEFASYFHYCQPLAFDQRPDYGFLKRLFRDFFTREGLQFDYLYDWTAQRYRQAQREKNEPQPSRLQTRTGVTSSRVIPRDLHKHQRRIGDVRAHQRCTNAARRGFVLQCQLA